MAGIVFVGLDQSNDQSGFISQTETCEFIGLGYLRAFLKQRNIGCKILQGQPSIGDILKEKPFIVGFSVMASNYEPSLEASRMIKNINPEVSIIWGGPQATSYYEEALSKGFVDYVVIGEGEKTAFELITGLKSSDVGSIHGLAFKRGDEIIKTSARSRLTPDELDSIDFRHVHTGNYNDFAKHIPHTMPYSEMRFADIIGSRGCWNDCSFCQSKSMWGRKVIFRDPANITAEVNFLVEEKDVNYIFFSDDDFLVNDRQAKNIAKSLLEEQVKIKYHIMASVSSASRFKDYDLLKKSGCSEITLGMESASQHILDKLGKGYEINSFVPIAEEIVKHGIHLGFYYMLGHPEQTLEDIKNDMQFIEKIPFSRIRPVFITPFPGTRLYREVEEKRLWLDGCRNNWSRFTCDQPVIKSSIPLEKLVEARKEIISLYLSDFYRERMNSLNRGGSRSTKAFEEFQEYVRRFI